MTETPGDCPRLGDAAEGEMFYATLFRDGVWCPRALLRRGAYRSNVLITCLDESTGLVYDLPMWKEIEVHTFQPSDVLSTPIDE